ncbi:MAG: HlyD family efflux transporter periplasmic adaptor subunit [Crocinitomicaceae bacterium]
MEEEEIELRSEEVQEIIGKAPNWTIRWGITVILGIVTMMILLSYFIKYPDQIPGSGVLTAENPPLKVFAPSGGELINITDKKFVKKGDIIAEIRNPLSKEGYLFIDSVSKVIRIKIEADSILQIDLKHLNNNVNLGLNSTNFNVLVEKISELQRIENDPFYSKQISFYKKQIQNYRSIGGINQKEYSSFKKVLDLDEAKFQKNKQLFEKGAMAEIEYIEAEKSYLNQKSDLEQIRKSMVQSKITTLNLEKELAEIEFQRNEKRIKLYQNIEEELDKIHENLIAWKQNYVITAQIDGEVFFTEKKRENEFVQDKEELLIITPKTQNYIVKAQLSANGLGKIEEGQKVRVSIANYPTHEFGELIGEIKDVSAVSKEGLYEVWVSVPEDLTTNYKKEIAYTPNMQVGITVVTEDLRLIDRIFGQFRKLINRE